MIEPAHFWIGVCKAVEVRQKTSRYKTQEKRNMDGRSLEVERIAADFTKESVSSHPASCACGFAIVPAKRR